MCSFIYFVRKTVLCIHDDMNTNLHTVIMRVKIPNTDESGYLNPINETTAVILSVGCIDKS
jgi:hypothetical protein